VTRTWDEMDGGWIDSRDIIERLEELEDAAKEEPNDFGCSHCGEGSMPSASEPSLCEDHAEELRILRLFAEEGSQVAEDWEHGEAFIPDDQFEDYARQFADDIGAITGQEGWPLDYIDWGRAADALKMDYSSIDIEGTTYWGR
jgi:hypothetical protein